MPPSNRLVGGALALLALVANGGSGQEPPARAAAELYLANHLNPWPAGADGKTRIRVCFAQSAKQACDDLTCAPGVVNSGCTGRDSSGCSFETRREIVAEALRRSWDVYSNLSFWDFGLCAAADGDDDPADALVVHPVAGCQAGFGNTAGYRSNHDHNSIFQLTFGADTCDDARDDGRWAGVVVHEVGHALGFLHEHQRAENFDAGGRPLRCLDGAVPAAGGTPRTTYDNWSIMQYCTNNLTGWSGAPDGFGDTVFLSAGDIEGVQKLFGVSAAARALRAVAAIDQLH